jgi:large subunit ribosomal protein L2
MALVKVKPTSAGRRAVVKVVNASLYKGRPLDSLTREQSKTAGRNNHGHITTRHKGGGHRQQYRVIDFRRNKDGIAPRLSVSSTTRTAALILRCCAMPTVSAVTSSLRRVWWLASRS